MNRRPVNSSHVSSVGYDAETATLEIEFQNGTVYQYAAVPQSVFDDMLRSVSVGKYFRLNVMGRYDEVNLGRGA